MNLSETYFDGDEKIEVSISIEDDIETFKSLSYYNNEGLLIAYIQVIPERYQEFYIYDEFKNLIYFTNSEGKEYNLYE